MCGYTTLRTALAAMAASTAEPPAFSTSMPAAEARAWGHVTMPRKARVTGRPVITRMPQTLTARPAIRPRGGTQGTRGWRSPSIRRRHVLFGLGEPHGFPDLGQVARVVVPVEVEHGIDEHRDRDLVRAHELLEQRDARLAREVGIAQRLEVGEHLPALRVERGGQLPDSKVLARGRHVGIARLDVDQWQIAVGEALEKRHRIPPFLEQEVAQHLSRGPLAGRCRAIRMGLESLELAAQIRPGGLRFPSQLSDGLVSHGPPPQSVASIQISARGLPL